MRCHSFENLILSETKISFQKVRNVCKTRLTTRHTHSYIYGCGDLLSIYDLEKFFNLFLSAENQLDFVTKISNGRYMNFGSEFQSEEFEGFCKIRRLRFEVINKIKFNFKFK